MSRVFHRVTTILGILGIGWMPLSLSPSRAVAEQTGLVKQVVLEQRTAQAGPVMINVAPQASDTSLVFSIVLDTHSVDLDQYDLSQLASLRNDQGLELQPEVWEAPKGGHHREGTLSFSRVGEDGIELIGPDVHGLELVIRQIAGVSETVIQWTLAE